MHPEQVGLRVSRRCACPALLQFLACLNHKSRTSASVTSAVLACSWPSVLRTIYGDQNRYETTYFAPFKVGTFVGQRMPGALMP